MMLLFYGYQLNWETYNQQTWVKEVCGDTLGWIFSVITIFFVFSFIFQVHSYNKVDELFMHTLKGHEYDYNFFFFLYIDWILIKLCRYFLIDILHCWKLFWFFSINFFSAIAYAAVSNNYLKNYEIHANASSLWRVTDMWSHVHRTLLFTVDLIG